jgi:hypothetical protein
MENLCWFLGWGRHKEPDLVLWDAVRCFSKFEAWWSLGYIFWSGFRTNNCRMNWFRQNLIGTSPIECFPLEGLETSITWYLIWTSFEYLELEDEGIVVSNRFSLFAGTSPGQGSEISFHRANHSISSRNNLCFQYDYMTNSEENDVLTISTCQTLRV